MSNKQTITGGCLCGDVSYHIQGSLTDASLCHCSICRKLTGSAYGAYATSLKHNFGWAAAAGETRCYAPTRDTKRYFCPRCGSFLATDHRLAPNDIFISLGTLDRVTPSRDITLEYQQFVASKAPWHTLQQSLPSFPAWPE